MQCAVKQTDFKRDKEVAKDHSVIESSNHSCCQRLSRLWVKKLTFSPEAGAKWPSICCKHRKVLKAQELYLANPALKIRTTWS